MSKETDYGRASEVVDSKLNARVAATNLDGHCEVAFNGCTRPAVVTVEYVLQENELDTVGTRRQEAACIECAVDAGRIFHANVPQPCSGYCEGCDATCSLPGGRNFNAKVVHSGHRRPTPVTATREEAKSEATGTPGSEATDKPNIGACDACGKQAKMTPVAYGDSGNSVADGSFCDECLGHLPDTEKCEDCGGTGFRGGDSPEEPKHNRCGKCRATGKANPSPPTQPDRPTGTIFDLDIFREKLERKGGERRQIATAYNEGAPVRQTMEAWADQLDRFAAELNTLIDNCMKQYVHTAQPVPIQGEGRFSVESRNRGRDKFVWTVVDESTEIEYDAAGRASAEQIAKQFERLASSKDQVVEAAAKLQELADLARTAWPSETGVSQAERDRAKSTIEAILLHTPQTEHLATALNPTEETETP